MSETSEIKAIETIFKKLRTHYALARKLAGRPLTYAEKILFGHLDSIPEVAPVRGKTYVNLLPDRVAMQDATAQMALLQFMLAGKQTAAVPSTVHCDHLLQAKMGAQDDLNQALSVNKEVYSFLQSVSQKYGLGFWGPGSGIIHQIVLENYALPGGMMIGTDSHTPNAGGMGMIAIGVGGADAVDVMTGMPWELKWPKLIGVNLKGQLNGWASPKDIILKIAGILTVKGGTGFIIEYFGEGTKNLSTTGKATITNMGAEVGATTSLFPFDAKGLDYLKSTGREDWVDICKSNHDLLCADAEVENNPEKFYDQLITIDLDTLEPHVVGPFTPDLDRGLSEFKAEIKEKNYPVELKVGLIGSCTNSSYEDLSRAASIAKQALDKGLKAKSKFLISPGSEQIFDTIKRDGILDIFEKLGAIVLTNSCGPCIGQWDRQDFKENTPNSIITSFNRNFKSRNDGNSETLAFIGSPETVTAMSIAGRLDFNPITDSLNTDSGETFRLSPPKGEELPKQGFSAGEPNFIPPGTGNKDIPVIIDEQSTRLQKLEPFSEWDQSDSIDQAFVLVKARGKCTTDHISPAGKWLKYRGHLDNISNNMYIGAVNAFTGEAGTGTNLLTGEKNIAFSNLAREYKKQGKPWIVIGDENYGEGSSREHAAMEPRYLGCRAVIARSLARIAETNLKKQGVLVGTFDNPADYDKIMEDDIITIHGLNSFKPGSSLFMTINHKDGKSETVKLNHTFSDYQIQWFKAGSALNLIRKSMQG